MPFVVFIGGLLENNSGKTTFAKELVTSFEKDLSLKTVPFKPLSGNNLFFNYDQIKENVNKYGDFISLDIVELMEQSSVDVPLTLVNPVNRVSTQAIAEKFYEEGSISTFFTRYSGSVTLFQRFTKPDKEKTTQSCFIVNEPIYKNQKFWNDLSLSDPVLDKASGIKYFKNEHEYYSLNSQYYAEATETTFDFLKEKSDAVIIESFNNSAHPAWPVREADFVIIVGPKTVFTYEPDAYFRAIDNFRTINKNKVTTTDEIVKITTPIEGLPLSLEPQEMKDNVEELVKKLSERIQK